MAENRAYAEVYLSGLPFENPSMEYARRLRFYLWENKLKKK